MAARYRIRKDKIGWTVYDIFTGKPAQVHSIPQTGLAFQDATERAELLSLAERHYKRLRRMLTQGWSFAK